MRVTLGLCACLLRCWRSGLARTKKNLKLIAKIKPEQPKEYLPTRIEGATVVLPGSKFACYKIVGKPLAKLPAFRKAPKDAGWLMVDEIFFN